jgi:hypothetical protein
MDLSGSNRSFHAVRSFYILAHQIQRKENVHDIENSSLFQGRSFEVSFFRGLASLKFGQPDELKAIENSSSEVKYQLEDPETLRIRELTELARMYEKNLITTEEYNKTKNQILKSL